MFNKVKFHMIKNSLDTTERKIFESLCNRKNSNTIEENKELAIQYANLPTVTQHHIGELYKNEALREAFLNDEELSVLKQGMSIVDKFFELHKEIEREGYKILCSPTLMEKMLLECPDVTKMKKVISVLQKELLSLEDNVSRKNKEKYQAMNPNEVMISTLDDSQKESLISLGFDALNGGKITFNNLKKMYNKKLYSINYNKAESDNNDYIKELSQAFFNVKKAFEMPS